MASAVKSEDIKKLRERTGVGLMDCKKALEEANGDLEKAIEILRKKGIAKAVKVSGRATKEGKIFTYTHGGGWIGVMLELACETDFVSRNEEFDELGKNLCLQIAASSPVSISEEDYPADRLEKEKEIMREQLKNEGKPEKILDKIIEGKIKKLYSEQCLLHQPYIKDSDKTIKDLITEAIAKFGENIQVKRFVRYELGED